MFQNLQEVYYSQEKFRASLFLTSRLRFTVYLSLSVREGIEIFALEFGALVTK